jgi:threonine dehydrogenase-like Zn-dependent dehydrogenase
MRSLSLDGAGSAKLVDAPTPEPAAGEMLVRVEVSAICGSELKSAPRSNPGHEAAGMVEWAPDGGGFHTGGAGRHLGRDWLRHVP